MNINYNILEKLREYYSESMSANEIKEIEQLIITDPEYARHDQLFRATEKAVKDTRKEWMQTIDGTTISADTRRELDTLKKNNKLDRRNRRSYLGLLFLIVASLIVYFAWPIGDQVDEQQAPPSNSRPIATDTKDPDEDLLSSPGNALKGVITIWTYTDENLIPKESEGRVPISIQQGSTVSPSYYFKQDSLFITIDDLSGLDLKSIYWLRNTEGSSIENYLQIKGALYTIDSTRELEQPLQIPSNDQLPELIR